MTKEGELTEEGTSRREMRYEVMAKYYDQAYDAKSELQDVPFYLEEAAQSGGPVLEMACGTGRILIPTARQGQEVTGVEVSPHMLEILRANVAAEPDEVRERITLVEGDMRTVDLGRTFPLVTFPFRPLQHLESGHDQLQTLRTAKKHLAEGGEIVLDLFYPDMDKLLTRIGEEIPELEWQDAADPEITVRRFFKKDGVDPVRQFFWGEFLFRRFKGEEQQGETERAHFTMTWYSLPQLEALVEGAGLRVTRSYGSMQRTPLDQTSRDIVLCLTHA